MGSGPSLPLRPVAAWPARGTLMGTCSLCSTDKFDGSPNEPPLTLYLKFQNAAGSHDSKIKAMRGMTVADFKDLVQSREALKYPLNMHFQGRRLTDGNTLLKEQIRENSQIDVSGNYAATNSAGWN